MSQRKQSGDVLYRVHHKKGVHIASSHKTKGRFRANLLNDNTNTPNGFAELEPVDVSENEGDYSNDYQDNQQKVELSPEEEKLAQLLGEALAAGTIYVLTKYVAPPVKRWWQNKAVPTMQVTWKILTDKSKDKPSLKGKKKSELHTNEIVTIDETMSIMFSHILEEKYEKYSNDIINEEAQRELLDIFILSALLTAKIRKLSNARIIKNGGSPEEYLEGQRIVERLTTPEYINSINQILKNNQQLMEEKTAALSKILGRNLVLDGQYVPIEIGKLKEAITLQVNAIDSFKDYRE